MTTNLEAHATGQSIIRATRRIVRTYLFSLRMYIINDSDDTDTNNFFVHPASRLRQHLVHWIYECTICGYGCIVQGMRKSFPMAWANGASIFSGSSSQLWSEHHDNVTGADGARKLAVRCLMKTR